MNICDLIADLDQWLASVDAYFIPVLGDLLDRLLGCLYNLFNCLT
jgi:hypothetical protein